MIPKWMGFTPSLVTIGSRMGVRIMMAALVSMKVPTIKSSTLMRSSTSILLLVSPRMASAIMTGTWVMVRMRPKPVDMPMMSSTGAHISTERYII